LGDPGAERRAPGVVDQVLVRHGTDATNHR
jgi:hypothetical protein